MAEEILTAHAPQKNRESLLETLESIIVAFVLAFIFRAFIIEAFVIPTGSMAPTLNGAHAEVKCQYCGYFFSVGGDGPGSDTTLCPNCFGSHSRPRPSYGGDRLLVLKYLYDFQKPRRWDVIVFHNPNNPAENFIKRLVGLPGETIEFRYGDVVIDGHIARKPDAAQEALWMVVHDTRYRPVGLEGWKERWVDDRNEWQVTPTGFVLSTPPAKDGTAWLAYRHRGPSGRLENISDFYGYNSGDTGHAVCTDLGLRTKVTAGQTSSVVVFEMRTYKDWFRFELTAEGSGQPARIKVNDKVVAQATGGVLPVGRAVEVQVANVDHKVMLLVGGVRPARALSPDRETTPEGDVIYESKPLSAEERFAFDHPEDLENPQHRAAEVRVGGRGGSVRLAYLRIDRDVYYLNQDVQDLHGESLGPGNGTQGHPLRIQPDSLFVCGDNSPKSYDSRRWSLPNPAVPQRNLVGKGFFVYWPSAGPRYYIPLPVVPDVEGFRMVH